MSSVGVVTGLSRPRWQVQQVTTWRPPKLSRLIAVTICTMRRAVRFRGVSSAQSTWSVPADGWQPTQSEPTAADMMPIVSMKSSTPMPFSAWTFLKTSSTIIRGLRRRRPACAARCARQRIGAATTEREQDHGGAERAPASIPILMWDPLLVRRVRGAACGARRLLNRVRGGFAASDRTAAFSPGYQ